MPSTKGPTSGKGTGILPARGQQGLAEYGEGPARALAGSGLVRSLECLGFRAQWPASWLARGEAKEPPSWSHPAVQGTRPRQGLGGGLQLLAAHPHGEGSPWIDGQTDGQSRPISLSPSAPALLISDAEAGPRGMGLTQGDAESQGHVGELQALLRHPQFHQQRHQLVAQPKLCLLVPCGHSQWQRPFLSTQVGRSGFLLQWPTHTQDPPQNPKQSVGAARSHCPTVPQWEGQLGEVLTLPGL